MARGIDLELIRGIFRDDAVHIALATVDRVQFADDATAVYVTCTLAPEGRQILATMGWDSVGAGSGSGDLPETNDLVLVCFADREVEHAYVFKRITSMEETLPVQMKDGHFVTKAKPGKKLILGSDTRTEIGRAVGPCTEPLVLGNVLVSFMTSMITRVEAIISALEQQPVVISSAPGTVALIAPALQAALDTVKSGLDADKSTYLTTAGTNILSQAVFTERGT